MVKKYAPLALLCTTCLLMGTVLASSFSFAEDTVIDDVIITVPASCTLTTNSGDGETYSVSMQNGQYKNDIGQTTLTAFCNSSNSFAIYAIGYSNDTYGNTEMITTTQGATNIATGTATSGATSNWAMKLESVTASSADVYTPTIENGFGSFSSVPSSYTQVAKVNSVTGGTGEMSVKATYAIFVSPTQTAGSYTGKVRYTAVQPASEVPASPKAATAGCISYWPNASGVVDNMGDQCGLSGDRETLLWPTNFQRSGYGFAGWTDQFDYQLSSNANTGHIYGPMEMIISPSDITTKGLSLYAVWVPSAGNLQNWTGCSSLASGAVTALTDTRDNNTYAVAKLADGKCWMIENLRLDNNNSDNATGLLAQGYNSSFVGLADAESPWGTGSSNTTANSLYSTDGSNGSMTISGSNLAVRFPRYNNNNTNNPVANMTTIYDYNIYSFGNYYTWSAVVADTGEYATQNQSITTTSICPAGWRLPQGGNKTRIESNDDNDYWNLIVDALNNGTNPANYSSAASPNYRGTAEASPIAKTLQIFPNNFLRAGKVDNRTVNSQFSSGYYWSSTVGHTGGSSYRLYFSESYVYPGTESLNRSNGLSVRCIVGS